MNDQSQRDQALDISDSFIVQAPAGSGKTELLTQRYLKLLSIADEPETILAITFTNKAVDELKHRVVSSLLQAKSIPPKEAHKLKTYKLANQVLKQSELREWDLLNNPSRIKISTIDSLSSLIVSKYPSLQQLIPPRIMSDRYEYEYMYQMAAEKTLMLIEEDEYNESIARVLLYLDNHVDKFYRLLVYMLSKREQWLPRLYLKGVLDVDFLERTAQQIIVEHLQVLREIASEYLNVDIFNLLRANTRPEVSKINKLPGDKLSDLSNWQIIADLLLAKSSGEWRKKIDKSLGFPPELKEQKKSLMVILKELVSADIFKKQLLELDQLPNAYQHESVISNINDISQVLKLGVAQLSLIFEEQGVQDFSEVGMQAIKALDSREVVNDIVLFLDYQIKHLLIDEFQDTSYAQLGLIQKLLESWQKGDGKTIFLVGDPMQSIYRFRESQVGIFLKVMKNGIANVRIKSLLLSTNFRSNMSVVESNNTFFSNIFPDVDNLIQGAIHFSKSTSASKDMSQDAVKFYPFSYDQNKQEAEQVSAIISEAQLHDPTQEIAVLVKSRTHLQDIIVSLQSHEINFEAVKTEPLRSDLFTRDLISLTRALISLGDKLAWLSILRSPWCGLKLNELLILSRSDEMTIFHQLSDDATLKEFTEDGLKRAKHLYQGISEAVFNEGRFSFVERFLYSLNQLHPDQEMNQKQQNIRSQFVSLLSECESNENLNIDTLELMLQDLYAPSQSSSVKLMTIHQAKGLEFDIVILPGLGKTGKSNPSALIQIQEFSNHNILLAPIKSAYDREESKTYLYLKYIEKQQSHFEMMRLLYVAMSRAKEKLHLLGSVNRSGKVSSNTFLDLLSHFYQEPIDNLENFTEENIKQLVAPKMMRYTELPTLSEREIQHINKPKNLSRNIDLIYQSALGTIVHYFLEHSLFEPSEKSVEIKLLEFGLPKKLLHTYTKQVCQLLQNTKQDKVFDWLFQYRESTQVEAEYSNNSKNIIIDRLFIEDGMLWIIDFKTASPTKGESIDAFIERQKNSHQEQLLEYQEILQNVFKLPTKLALYCPAISQLIYL